MIRKRRLFTALLTAAVMMLFTGCGGNGESDSASAEHGRVSITVVSDPDVHGWMEMALSQAPPVHAEAGDKTAWLLFQGGSMLRFDTEQGKWKSYILEGLGDPVDFDLSGEMPVILTSDEFIVFRDEDAEMVAEPLPEGFDPLELGVSGDEAVILGTGGKLAVMEEDGFTVYSPERDIEPVGGLCRIGPDWIYMLEGGEIALFDPSIALWQFEESPEGNIMTASSNILFIGRNDSIFVRTSPGEWMHHARGRLYDGGLVLSDNGISSVMSPGEMIADTPAFTPSDLFAMNRFQEPLWAVDDMGMTVYSDLGTVETSLPYYETQRVSCSLAGQGAGGMQGSAESVSDMIQAGGGTFRIYESVSIRPDPFTEFSSETRDSRRNLEEISVEEFRLVGITLDPIGGDQAMVEDGLGVPYVMYEGTELANNSHVAEITSNEVIVIQDVIVDYSARGGGETTIPTIYSLRLHEEGGL
ncbi:MAG: hypothetical protein R6U39_09210 [Candidatus Aegiribacteria sp.]